MLATISSPISSSFGAFEQLSWILTAYAIGSAISQPLSGHLTDIFGRRKGLVVCYILFTLGTLLCGLSTHLWLFLTGRIIQGLGGGALASITSFIESDLVPLRKRALIEGIGNIAFGATLALGGIYGGAINHAIGWKWAFLIQVPVIALDAILVICSIRIPNKEHKSSSSGSIDYIGCVLLLLSIIFFQYGLNAGSSVSWNTPLVISSITLAGAGFAAFIYYDLFHASNPVLPLKACMHRTIASSQLSFFFNSAATAAILFYVPIYLQVLGISPSATGVRFIPYAIAFGLGSFAAGYLVKITGRYYLINVFIQVSSLAGAIALCTMNEHTPAAAPFIFLILLGIGFGGAYVTRLMGLLSSADSEKQAVIQAASWTISSAGFTIGIAAASAVFLKLSLGNLEVILSKQPELLSAVRGSFEAVNSLVGMEKVEVVGVYLKALRGVFYLAMGEMAVSALTSFCMEDNVINDDEKSDLKDKETDNASLES
jgi:MFS family permease